MIGLCPFEACCSFILPQKASRVLYNENCEYFYRIFFSFPYFLKRGKTMANYPKELAQDAAYRSHTGRLTLLWFLQKLAQGLNTNNKKFPQKASLNTRHSRGSASHSALRLLTGSSVLAGQET
jgi:hypothetical protein